MNNHHRTGSERAASMISQILFTPGINPCASVPGGLPENRPFSETLTQAQRDALYGAERDGALVLSGKFFIHRDPRDGRRFSVKTIFNLLHAGLMERDMAARAVRCTPEGRVVLKQILAKNLKGGDCHV